MNVFVDANIIVAVINKEYPLFTNAARILSLNERNGIKIFTSPLCLAIAFYFSEKKSGTQFSKKKIELLINNITITSINQGIVMNAIQNKMINDFEDGIEYYSALNSGCDIVVTEDIGDFYFSEIQVLSSEEFLFQKILNKK